MEKGKLTISNDAQPTPLLVSNNVGEKIIEVSNKLYSLDKEKRKEILLDLITWAEFEVNKLD